MVSIICGHGVHYTPGHKIFEKKLIKRMDDIKWLYSGIFGDEKCIRFLEICKHDIVDKIMNELHALASKKQGKQSVPPSEMIPHSIYGQSFLLGLNSIRTWNTDIFVTDINNIKRNYPLIEDMYKYTVVRYVQEIYKHESKQKITLKIPPFKEFIHKLILGISQNTITVNFKYWQINGMEKTNMMMTAIRFALASILDTQLDYTTSLSVGDDVATTRSPTKSPTPRTQLKPEPSWTLDAILEKQKKNHFLPRTQSREVSKTQSKPSPHIPKTEPKEVLQTPKTPKTQPREVLQIPKTQPREILQISRTQPREILQIPRTQPKEILQIPRTQAKEVPKEQLLPTRESETQLLNVPALSEPVGPTESRESREPTEPRESTPPPQFHTPFTKSVEISSDTSESDHSSNDDDDDNEPRLFTNPSVKSERLE